MQLTFDTRRGHHVQSPALSVVTTGPGAGLKPRLAPACLPLWPTLRQNGSLARASSQPSTDPIPGLLIEALQETVYIPAVHQHFTILEWEGPIIPATTLRCSVKRQQNENNTPLRVTITLGPNTLLLGNYLENYSEM